MIVFGTRTRASRGAQLQLASCPNCAKSELTRYNFFTYLHIFWVPFLPLKRTSGVECGCCKFAAFGKDIPEETHREDEVIDIRRYPPAYMYSGLVGFAMLFCAALYQTDKHGKIITELYNNPQVGDHYIVEIPRRHRPDGRREKYQLMRLEQLKPDSLVLKRGTALYRNISEARKVAISGPGKEGTGEDYFSNRVMEVSKTLLENVRSSGYLVDIVRS